MNKQFTYILISAMAMASTQGNAQAMSQRDAIALIVANNPSVKSIQASGRADVLSMQDANVLPDPEISGGYLFGDGTDNRWELEVSQGFAWPGLYGARKKAINSASAANDERRRLAALEVADKARQQMVRGTYLTQQLALLEDVKANMDSLARSIQYGYDKGELTLLDLKKIRFEIFRLDAQITQVQSERRDVDAALAALNNGEAVNVDFSQYDVEPLNALPYYIDKARQSPALALTDRQAETARLEGEAARLGRLPSLALGYKHSMEDGYSFNGVTASVSVPVFSGRKARQAAQARQAAAEYDRAQVAGDIDTEVSALYQQTVQRQQLLKDFAPVVLDDEYPELLLLAYRGGETNVITLIQEMNYYLQARQEYLEADYSYRASLASLNRYDLPF